MTKRKDNPGYVTLEMCTQKYTKLDDKITEILHLLKGNPDKSSEDLGLLGDIRDIKRDRKWIYGLIVIGIPIFVAVLTFIFTRAGI